MNFFKYHLRTYVIRGSNDRIGADIFRQCAHDFADSKISNFDCIVFCQKNICSFQIPEFKNFFS